MAQARSPTSRSDFSPQRPNSKPRTFCFNSIITSPFTPESLSLVFQAAQGPYVQLPWRFCSPAAVSASYRCASSFSFFPLTSAASPSQPLSCLPVSTPPGSLQRRRPTQAAFCIRKSPFGPPRDVVPGLTVQRLGTFVHVGSNLRSHPQSFTSHLAFQFFPNP